MRNFNLSHFNEETNCSPTQDLAVIKSVFTLIGFSGITFSLVDDIDEVGVAEGDATTNDGMFPK